MRNGVQTAETQKHSGLIFLSRSSGVMWQCQDLIRGLGSLCLAVLPPLAQSFPAHGLLVVRIVGAPSFTSAFQVGGKGQAQGSGTLGAVSQGPSWKPVAGLLLSSCWVFRAAGRLGNASPCCPTKSGFPALVEGHSMFGAGEQCLPLLRSSPGRRPAQR